MAASSAVINGIGRAVLLGAACALTAMVTLWWQEVSAVPAPLWPAAGVALAGLVIGSIRLWPAVTIALFVAPWLVGQTPSPAVQGVMALAWTAGAVASAGAVRRMHPAVGDTFAINHVLILIAACFASAAIAALIGAGGLVAVGAVPVHVSSPIIDTWFIRDGVGSLITAPFFVAWGRRRVTDMTLRRALHLGLILLSTSIAGWFVFVLSEAGPRSWIMLPLLVWAALAYQLRGATAAMISLAVAAVAGTTQGMGPFSADGRDMAGNIVLLQQFLACAGATIMVLAAMADEYHAAIELRLTTETLQARETQLALFIEHTPAAIAVFDLEMRYLACSRRLLNITLLPPDTNLIGQHLYDVFPDLPQSWRDIHTRVLAGEEISGGPDAYTHPDGHVDFVRWVSKPWYDKQGKIGGLTLLCEVVTDSVLAQRAIEAAEARYRSAFEQAAVGFVRIGPDGHFLEMNERFCTIVGRERGDLLASTFADVTHPDDWAENAAVIDRLFAGDLTLASIEQRYPHEDGSIVWSNVSANLIRNADGTPNCCIAAIEDVSARKAAEAALRDSEARLRLAQEAAGVRIWQYDPVKDNSVTLSITGSFGNGPADGGPITPDETWNPLTDGSDIIAYTAAETAIAAGALFDHTVAIRTKEDGPRWIRGLGRAEYAPNGKPLRLIGLAIDVSNFEKAQLQLRIAHEELLRVSRLSAIGAFASTLAHELNQPLTAAASCMQACELALEDHYDNQPDDLMDMVKLAAAEVLRAGEIIRKMRRFTISGEIAVQPEDLPNIIEKACAALRRRPAAAGVAIRCDYDPQSRLALVDPIQIGQVVANLLMNAVEAMRDHPVREIDITTRRQGNMTLITVQDSGSGFAPGVLEHLFEPFRTTKETGTGLGLSICRTIVEGHGGKLWAEQAPDGGAILSMTLRYPEAGAGTTDVTTVQSNDPLPAMSISPPPTEGATL